MLPTDVNRLHRWIRSWHVFVTATSLTRLLLAVGFIPPGLTKVLGRPFTILGPDSAVGYFFDAFFQSDSYYAFVGLAQVVAGLLLLIPRTSLLGALIYLPIILNIFVITVALGFQGTWIIAGFMVLANLYLLFWDLHRLRPILWMESPQPLPEPRRLNRRQAMQAALATTLACFFCISMFLLAGTGLPPENLVVPGLVTGIALMPLTASCWLEWLNRIRSS